MKRRKGRRKGRGQMCKIVLRYDVRGRKDYRNEEKKKSTNMTKKEMKYEFRIKKSRSV
jgi:hypothetical protein